MFDHVKFGVSDYAASKNFFLKALEPLGLSVGSEGAPTYGVELCTKAQASLCLFQSDEKPAHLHLAFVAEDRQQVEAFFALRWKRVAKTMVRLACARTTTRPTTQLSSLARTGTTSKWFAMSPSTNASERIDQLLAELVDWRGSKLAAVRQAILAADAAIDEEWKYMGSPVWSCDGIIAVGNAHKNKAKLTFAHGASLADPHRLFNNGFGGKVWREIDLGEGDTLDAHALTALVRTAIEHNRSKSKKSPHAKAYRKRRARQPTKMLSFGLETAVYAVPCTRDPGPDLSGQLWVRDVADGTIERPGIPSEVSPLDGQRICESHDLAHGHAHDIVCSASLCLHRYKRDDCVA